MKNKSSKSNTIQAYFQNKDGTKQWFNIPKETAEKVIKLQKMFREEKERKQITKTK